VKGNEGVKSLEPPENRHVITGRIRKGGTTRNPLLNGLSEEAACIQKKAKGSRWPPPNQKIRQESFSKKKTQSINKKGMKKGGLELEAEGIPNIGGLGDLKGRGVGQRETERSLARYRR